MICLHTTNINLREIIVLFYASLSWYKRNPNVTFSVSFKKLELSRVVLTERVEFALIVTIVILMAAKKGCL